jgi:hypothetical protein
MLLLARRDCPLYTSDGILVEVSEVVSPVSIYLHGDITAHQGECPEGNLRHKAIHY